MVVGAELTSTLVEWLLGSKDGGQGMWNNINFGIATNVVVRGGGGGAGIPRLSLPSDCLCLCLNPPLSLFLSTPCLSPLSLLLHSLYDLNLSFSLSPPILPFLYPPSLSPSLPTLSISLPFLSLSPLPSTSYHRFLYLSSCHYSPRYPFFQHSFCLSVH